MHARCPQNAKIYLKVPNLIVPLISMLANSKAADGVLWNQMARDSFLPLDLYELDFFYFKPQTIQV